MAVLRRCAAEGEDLTFRVEEEHQQINDLVADVERLPVGDPEREEKVRRAFVLVRQDIRDEEDLLLPRLQEAMDTAGLRRLGAAWETVRGTAPTHPHPLIPRRPPDNAVLGVPLSLYDRARIAFGSAGSGAALKKGPMALAGVALSVALAAAVRRHSRHRGRVRCP